MFQDGGTVEIVILHTIGKRLADQSARKDFVLGILPLHGQRRQMPVVRTGNARAVCIRALMTRGAVQAGHAFASGAADHVKQMAVAVVALLRIVRGGVATNATGMR